MAFTVFLSKWSPALAGPRIDPARLDTITARYSAADGVHLVLGQGARILRLCCEPGTELWGGILMPPGPQSRKRLETSQWLLHRLAGQLETSSPEGMFFSPGLLRYLIMLLRLLDGIQAGANLRQLATILIDPDLATFKSAFPGSGPAKKIQRWRSDAQWLVKGGYRRLLRGEWPSKRRR